jgi:hypothetical protein
VPEKNRATSDKFFYVPSCARSFIALAWVGKLSRLFSMSRRSLLTDEKCLTSVFALNGISEFAAVVDSSRLISAGN